MHPWPFGLAFLCLQLVHGDPEPARDDCHVYQLRRNETRHRTPSVAFRGRVEVSVMPEAGAVTPRQLIIQLELAGNSSETANVFINNDSVALLRINETQVGGNLSLAATNPHNNTWFTLVLALHQHQLLVYRPENRQRILTAELSVSITTVFVSSNEALQVVFNCASGCLINTRSTSPGAELKIERSSVMYVNPQDAEGGGGQQPTMFLIPVNSRESDPLKVDLSNATTGQWSKLLLLLGEDQNSDRGSGSAEDNVTVAPVRVKNVSYRVNVTSVFWTFQCYPDSGRGQDCVTPTDSSSSPSIAATTEQSTSDATSAGMGQVLAWVLTGLALFLVMILALALCSRMTPNAASHTDFQPSVGDLSHRYGVSFESRREAEEDSEPGSPIMTVPHRLHPDDHYSTKVL
nr:uncharacterized protein LOC123767371 [Procambarus clarkii]XP_045612983.1 uncharacterized protein LOC123767371 [Procambarus clarkii]